MVWCMYVCMYDSPTYVFANKHSLAMHQERTNKHANEEDVPDGAVPAYLIDREGMSRAKVCL